MKRRHNLKLALESIRSTDLIEPGYYIVEKEFNAFYNNQLQPFIKNTILFFSDNCKLYTWSPTNSDDTVGEWKELTITDRHHNFDFMSLGPVKGFDVYDQISRYISAYNVEDNQEIPPAI